MATRAWPSPELVAAGWAADPALTGSDGVEAPLALWRVNAALFDAESAVTLLAGLPSTLSEMPASLTGASELGVPLPVLLGEDLRFWAAASRCVLSLLARQRYVPGAKLLPLLDVSGYWQGPRVISTWEPALADAEGRAYYHALVAAMPDLCRAAAPTDAGALEREQIPSRREMLDDFLHIAVRGCIVSWMRRSGFDLHLPGTNGAERYDGHVSYGHSYYYSYNPMPGTSVTYRWIRSLPTPEGGFYIAPTEVRPFLEGMRQWHEHLPSLGEGRYRLCFRLIAPGALVEGAMPDQQLPEPPTNLIHHPPSLTREGGAEDLTLSPLAHRTRGCSDSLPTHEQVSSGEERSDLGHRLVALEDAGEWELEYLLQARDDPSLLVPMADVWLGSDGSPGVLDGQLDRPYETVRVWLSHAASYFPPIAASLQEWAPARCLLTGAEAYTFLVEAAPLLAESDFGVLLPPWWKRARVKPRLHLLVKGRRREGSGLLGLDAICSYDWNLALGDEEITRKELERLVQLKEPLIRLRGQWVQLQRAEVDAMVAFMRKHSSGPLSLGEALRATITGQISDGAPLVEEVHTDGWIGDLLARLRSGEALAEIAPPEGLRGTLRPYQLRGLGWLDFLTRYGLGACLADDMGLGKSIQLLAVIQLAKANGQLTKPILLVCPTSVVGNWRHESTRFTPELRLLIHHGAERSGRTDVARFKEEVAGHDLVVTTYSLLPRDEEALAAIEWGGVVLDEAQNIKNPETRQSRVARGLRAPLRAALTGTPIENRLAELWSIMDFLNPGYLGSHTHFQETLGYPVERLRDPRAIAQLQALVRPFVLRRLKTDPNVIRDLPEKLEIKEYCSLTREQITLYEAVVRDGLRRLDEAESPMQRRGVILSMLVRLKQVCNHPAHLLSDGSSLPGRSGKLIRLEELIEELLGEGDRALIFTQFTALGDRLRPYLEERFGVEVLYLHGGVARTARERMVARFQSPDGPRLFLLSLKAGGLGLNLTNANHVIHFDRWWNPAVENQATDRAFRIGQVRNVQVRKLICSGTLEERIDQLIELKKGLAEQVIGSSEGWLTELSTEQLRDLFALRADALAD
jgi:SNF2 family DNA or RNA helicase